MKSILVIGMGLFGRHIAYQLQKLGNDVMIMDNNADIINELEPDFTDANIGDATSEIVLRSLGVKNFDICFVAIGGNDFQANMEVTSALKEMGAPFVVSKACSERQEKLLKKIGADEVIYPEKQFAEKVAVRYNADNVFDFIELTDEYSIFEIPILSAWVGKTLAELNVRRKYKINVIATKSGNKIKPSPGAEYEFAEGDHIIVIGKSHDVFKLASRA